MTSPLLMANGYHSKATACGDNAHIANRFVNSCSIREEVRLRRLTDPWSRGALELGTDIPAAVQRKPEVVNSKDRLYNLSYSYPEGCSGCYACLLLLQ